MQDFKWHGDDEKESIIIKEVKAIAVYINVNDDIVIRQESDGVVNGEDAVVVIPKLFIPQLIAKLKEVLAENS